MSFHGQPSGPLPGAPDQERQPGAGPDEPETGAPLQNDIEPDPYGYDEDEGYDESYGTDRASTASTSLTAGVRDYAFENGRRYHKYEEGRYLMPNDEPEQEREDMKHAMIVNAMDGKLHLAPIQNPQRILDIGTGTGIWAVDMGDEYPEAEVIGIDLSPIQPTWVPPNVRFLVDDAEADWVTAPDSLDLVHARHLCMAIKDFPRMVQQSYAALRPGGWIELQELRFVVGCDDGTLPPDYGYEQFVHVAIEGFRKFGVDPLVIEKNAPLLMETGFTNVEEKVWKIPIGTWPRDKKLKTVGLYNRCMIYDAVQAVGMAPLTRGLKWTPQEVEVFLVDVRKSLMNSNVHSYLTFHVVYGQKPF